MSSPAPLVDQIHAVDAPRRILAIWAHPDDESFGPVVSFRRAADAGVALALITATRGEQGQIGLPDVSRTELGQIREAELLAAAGLIGFGQVQILGYPDGGLSDMYELPQAINTAIRTFQPHVVVTFGPDGITGHPDHLAVGAATTLCFSRLRVPVGTDGPWKLYYVTLAPGRTPPELVHHAPPLPPTTIVRAPEYTDVKFNALTCHRSQLPDPQNLPFTRSEMGVDYFFRAFPSVLPGEPLEDDLLAGV